MRVRLDAACVERGLFESRERALRAIMAGGVLLNGRPAAKAGQPVRDGDEITLAVPDCPYVSRGGLKLKGALKRFGINLAGQVCADIGASTGGFTDCMLQEGASAVYAVDVGAGQLHEKLRSDARVVFMPGLNARFLEPGLFPVKPGFCAIDVSFISLKLVLGPVLKILSDGGSAVALVKPQFELAPAALRKGIVKTEELRLQALEGLRNGLGTLFPEAEERGCMDSTIKGARGNLEFLWYLGKKETEC